MEVIEFYKTLRRMCHFYLEYLESRCAGCPLEKFEKCNITAYTDTEIMREIVSAVEDWASKNPPKTRLEDLMEKYPRAHLSISGRPEFCCACLGYCNNCYKAVTADDCAKCWNTPIDD